MKNLLLFVTVVFALCSCAKDYAALQKERVAQYEKEGKIILAKSDSTSSGHYIIYADEKTQTIGIDTLDGDARIIDLKTIKETNFGPMDGTGVFDMLYESGEAHLTIKDGKLSHSRYDGFTYEPQSVYFFKDKYMIVSYDKEYNYILFFTEPVKLYFCFEYSFRDRENLENDLGIDSGSGDINCVFKWDEYYDQEYPTHCIYRATLDCNGNLKSKDDYLLMDGVSVPVHAYTEDL